MNSVSFGNSYRIGMPSSPLELGGIKKNINGIINEGRNAFNNKEQFGVYPEGNNGCKFVFGSDFQDALGQKIPNLAVVTPADVSYIAEA